MAKLTRTVNYANFRWEEYILTEEELAKWKTGDEDLQQEIIDDADWDLVRDKQIFSTHKPVFGSMLVCVPIDDYGDVEFVEND